MADIRTEKEYVRTLERVQALLADCAEALPDLPPVRRAMLPSLQESWLRQLLREASSRVNEALLRGPHSGVACMEYDESAS